MFRSVLSLNGPGCNASLVLRRAASRGGSPYAQRRPVQVPLPVYLSRLRRSATCVSIGACDFGFSTDSLPSRLVLGFLGGFWEVHVSDLYVFIRDINLGQKPHTRSVERLGGRGRGGGLALWVFSPRPLGKKPFSGDAACEPPYPTHPPTHPPA